MTRKSSGKSRNNERCYRGKFDEEPVLYRMTTRNGDLVAPSIKTRQVKRYLREMISVYLVQTPDGYEVHAKLEFENPVASLTRVGSC